MAHTVLIDTQTHSSTNLLMLLGGAVTMLKRTYLEDVWIIPAFLERRVGEDKTYRFFKREETLLITHDELISIRAILCISSRLRLCLSSCILREVAIMWRLIFLLPLPIKFIKIGKVIFVFCGVKLLS